jgi:hypothetical protein
VLTAWAPAPYSRNPAIHAHILGRERLPAKRLVPVPAVEATIKTAAADEGEPVSSAASEAATTS